MPVPFPRFVRGALCGATLVAAFVALAPAGSAQLAGVRVNAPVFKTNKTGKFAPLKEKGAFEVTVTLFGDLAGTDPLKDDTNANWSETTLVDVTKGVSATSFAPGVLSQPTAVEGSLDLLVGATLALPALPPTATFRSQVTTLKKGEPNKVYDPSPPQPLGLLPMPGGAGGSSVFQTDAMNNAYYDAGSVGIGGPPASASAEKLEVFGSVRVDGYVDAKQGVKLPDGTTLNGTPARARLGVAFNAGFETTNLSLDDVLLAETSITVSGPGLVLLVGHCSVELQIVGSGTNPCPGCEVEFETRIERAGEDVPGSGSVSGLITGNNGLFIQKATSTQVSQAVYAHAPTGDGDQTQTLTFKFQGKRTVGDQPVTVSRRTLTAQFFPGETLD